MGECAAQTFSNIAPQKWLAIQTKAAGENINLSGDKGQITEKGFTFTWQYEPVSEILTIHCLDHPFWATCGAVSSKVHDLVDSFG